MAGEVEHTIDAICGREVLDSRGRPTLEVDLRSGTTTVRAMVPSGASTGKHEAHELRDGDPRWYGGLGVQKAIANVKLIERALTGLPLFDQAGHDRRMCDLDGTPNKSRLGANAILGVSMAIARAIAAVGNRPLWQTFGPEGQATIPLPMVNMISGGLHAGGNLDLQDFLFLPVAARQYTESLHMSVAVYRCLGEILRERGFEGTLVGDEGGYGPRLHSNEQALELLTEAIRRAGMEPGKGGGIALDVAASHFHADGRYRLRDGGGVDLDAGGMVDLLARWVDAYPIFSIEDGLAEDDFDGWSSLTERLGARVQLIGDDLFVTNPERLRMGITRKLGNAVLVKLNQIGTVSETLRVIEMSREAGYRTIVSARSGETEDDFMADFAVGTGAGQIKIGSVARSERLAKYNQLSRIEDQVGMASRFARWPGLAPARKGPADGNV
jgi:enolase